MNARKSSRRDHLAIVGLLLLIAASDPTACGASTVKVIVVTGDLAPGGNGMFSTLDIAPALNDSGHVAFVASLMNTNGGSTDDRGIFRSDGTTTVQIARESQTVPDGNGKFGTFQSNFHTTNINESGQVSFDALLYDTVGDSADDWGIFRSDGSTLLQLARKGQSAPDGNGGFGVGFGEHALNNAGQASFKANLTNAAAGTSEAIYRADGGALVTIARGGQDAPGIGEKLVQFDTSTSLNDAGQVAFAAYTNSVSGVFRGDGGPLTLIARSNQMLPDGNGRYSGTPSYSTRLNDSGQAAFFANFNSTIGGVSDNTGILRGDGTALVIIAREGQTAPDGNGKLSDFTGAGFTAPAAINETGQVAFDAGLSGTLGGTSDDYGLFRSDGATLVQVVREGQSPPDGNGRFDLRSRPALSAAGELAFRSELAGTSGGASDDAGIFFFDDALGLMKVVREGDDFLGSKIADLSFASPDRWADEGSGLNEHGVARVAFFFRLTDQREGIAVWSPVPEPTSATLLGVGLLSAWLLLNRSHAGSRHGCSNTRDFGRLLTPMAALLIVAGGSATSSQAATYNFIKIADTNGTFGRFGAHSISSDGTVAFYGVPSGEGPGIYTGNGGPIATIADSSGPFLEFPGFPTINAGGTVAFHATLDAGEAGIFTGSGGLVTTIADTSGPFGGFAIGGTDSSPAINDGGAVAFRAALDAGGEGIFVGSGGPITTIADSNGPFKDFGAIPDLNASGTAVFQATLDAGGRGIFTGSGGPTATIADSSGPFDSLGGPAINSSGEVAFATVFDDHFMPNIHFGVIKGSGGPTTTVADLGFPPFSNLRAPVSINSAGQFLFRADLNNSNPAQPGIFTGPDPVADKVITFGDPLFGATVRALGFNYRSLSDNGDVAFLYELSSGVSGIAVARLVPEPSSAILLAVVVMGVWTSRRRRRACGTKRVLAGWRQGLWRLSERKSA